MNQTMTLGNQGQFRVNTGNGPVPQAFGTPSFGADMLINTQLQGSMGNFFNGFQFPQVGNALVGDQFRRNHFGGNQQIGVQYPPNTGMHMMQPVRAQAYAVPQFNPSMYAASNESSLPVTRNNSTDTTATAPTQSDNEFDEFASTFRQTQVEDVISEEDMKAALPSEEIVWSEPQGEYEEEGFGDDLNAFLNMDG